MNGLPCLNDDDDECLKSQCFPWPVITVQRALPWPPNELLHVTTSCKYVNSNDPFNGVQLTTVRTLQGGETVNQIRTP